MLFVCLFFIFVGKKGVDLGIGVGVVGLGLVFLGLNCLFIDIVFVMFVLKCNFKKNLGRMSFGFVGKVGVKVGKVKVV